MRFLAAIVLVACLFAVSCVRQGARWSYAIDRSQSSNVIRDAQAIVTVERTSSDDTELRLDVRIKPVLGAERTRTLVRTVPTDLITPDVIESLRKAPMEGDDYRATWLRADGACDWVRLDKFPPDADVRDLVVNAKVCRDAVPLVLADFVAQGRQLKLGLVRR
jgi:hypothetical protein